MSERLKILLVEDDLEHLQLTKYILQRNNVPGDVIVVRDGQEAVDFLYHKNKFAGDSGVKPNLVLLDLNIPRINGREVLRIMKHDDLLKDIPVVVVSSSNRQEDIAYARQSGASAYISKSGGFEKLNEALSTVHQFASKVRV